MNGRAGWEAVAMLAKWAGQELRALEAEVARLQAELVEAKAQPPDVFMRQQGSQDFVALPAGCNHVRFLEDPTDPGAGWVDVTLQRPPGKKPYVDVTTRWGDGERTPTERDGR
jgi:hypothetical protein